MSERKETFDHAKQYDLQVTMKSCQVKVFRNRAR